MKHEAWFFIGLFVFIFVVWIAIGGPTRGAHLALPTLPTLSAPAGSASTSASIFGPGAISMPQAPFGIGTTYISLPGTDGSAPSEAAPFTQVPGVTYPAPSPYRGIVTLAHYVGNASTTARTEYVELSVSQSASQPVDITGWELVSGATARHAYIGQGTPVPTSGIVNPVSDIVLAPGERAIVNSGVSPVGGSFRENKCTGYFGSVQSFTPSLDAVCPSAENELYTYYGKPYIHDPDCINYTQSIGVCRMPTAAREDTLNLTCQSFLDTYLNYNGCRTAHGADQDFPGHTWRIYLGRKLLTELSYNATYDERQAAGPLWRSQYEVVELLDKGGYLVDTFTY